MNSEKTSGESKTRRAIAVFSETQWRLYMDMHVRYRVDRDLLDETERARLLFIRWLYENGMISL
jgi:hypothetical protein